MATSEIKLYTTELTPDKNAVIDDIDIYLNSKSKLEYTSTNFQYQKIALEKSVILSIDQSNVGNQSLGNYCSIHQDDRYYYYFIKDAEWVSQNAVKLNLYLDTVNTFKDKLEFLPQTYVQREHKNRVSLGAGQSTHIGSKKLKRIIDKYPEGINPQLFGDSGSDIVENNNYENWYIIYNSDKISDPNNPPANIPISTLICKDTGFTASIANTKEPTISYSASELTDNTYYCVSVPDNISVKAYNSDNQEIYVSKTQTQHIPGGPEKRVDSMIVFYKDGQSISYYSVFGYLKGVGHGALAFLVEKSEIKTVSTIKLSGDNVFYVYNHSGDPFPSSYKLNVDSYNSRLSEIKSKDSSTAIGAGGFSNTYIDEFSKINRTQSTLIKIIKLPYCPINYTIKNNVYVFDSGITAISVGDLGARLLSIPTSIKFGRTLSVNVWNPFKYVTDEFLQQVDPLQSIQETAESKLYHSEFYQPKVVYDSFSKKFNLELINRTSLQNNYLSIKYTPSRVFNSSFLFEFPQYSTNGNNLEDYNNILIANRNNEMPIYSNAYLNYVRTGYNYDVKAKNQKNVTNWIGTGLNVLGTGIGIATGEKLLTAGAGMGVISSIVSNVSSSIEADRDLNKKLADSNAQATSVSNCDDIDLLQAYSKNKAKLITYKINDITKNHLQNLFYYTGYKCNDIKVPNVNSRYWFNYIQCKPLFKHETSSIYNKYLDDIKSRFESGITFFHHHNEIGIGWDLDQEHENWETEVLDTSYLAGDKLDLDVDGFTYSVTAHWLRYHIRKPLSSTEYLQVKVDTDIGVTRYVEKHYDDEKLEEMIIPDKPGKPMHLSMRRCSTQNESLNSDWYQII